MQGWPFQDGQSRAPPYAVPLRQLNAKRYNSMLPYYGAPPEPTQPHAHGDSWQKPFAVRPQEKDTTFPGALLPHPRPAPASHEKGVLQLPFLYTLVSFGYYLQVLKLLLHQSPFRS